LTVELSRKDTIGKVHKDTMRNGKIPTRTIYCVPPGEEPVAC
jgi:hypothetical protein